MTSNHLSVVPKKVFRAWVGSKPTIVAKVYLNIEMLARAKTAFWKPNGRGVSRVKAMIFIQFLPSIVLLIAIKLSSLSPLSKYFWIQPAKHFLMIIKARIEPIVTEMKIINIPSQNPYM